MPTRPIRLSTALGLLAGLAAAQQHREPPTVASPTSFAVVVDAGTWRAIPDAVRHYRDAVERDGLRTWILVDDWQRPDAVRAALAELCTGPTPLEGALLIGQVPIAMLRGAQHLTSSFKMDEERFPRLTSSVPSDRFYEDFALVFTPLGRDEQQPLLHYYQLAAESPQRVQKQIYTARLFAAGDQPARHAALGRCLERFAARDRPAPVLDRALTLMGHGYLSDSLAAWQGGLAALTEAVPALAQPGGALVPLHHSLDQQLERALLRELADPALDLAILHSHGDDDRQYLTGAPPLPSATSQVEALRRHLRNQLRRARERGKSEDDLRRELRERWQLTDAWFDGAFDPAVTAADLAREAQKELETAEVAAVPCGAEVVELDSCFNGAFPDGDYQAAAYLFGEGSVQAVVANSVNVAQDVSGDRFVGMLALGQRVGIWHRNRPHLESHLFGDPTFRFAPTLAVDGDSAPARQLALTMAAVTGNLEQRCLDALRNDPAAIVRREALAQLARGRGAALPEALAIAARDPSPLLRSIAAGLMGDTGDPAHLDTLVHAALRDPCERVVHQADGALAKYAPDDVAAALDRALATMPEALRPDRDQQLARMRTPGFLAEYLAEAADRERTPEKRARALRTFRLYRQHAAVPTLIGFATDTAEVPAVRMAALEALGWFGFSVQRPAAEAAAARVAADESAPAEVRAEAQKTGRRLATGANDPLLP